MWCLTALLLVRRNHCIQPRHCRHWKCCMHVVTTPDECALCWLGSVSLLDLTELQTTGGAGQLTGGCCLSRLCWQAGSSSTQEGHGAQQLAAGSGVINCCCCCWQGLQLLGAHRRCNGGAQGLHCASEVCFVVGAGKLALDTMWMQPVMCW